jgi:DNA-binding protein
MTEKIVYIGKKPLHAYIKAVATAFEEGEKSVNIIARGATISRAVDVAEVCRRRNGIIASTLPESIQLQGVEIGTEEVPRDDGMKPISRICITLTF